MDLGAVRRVKPAQRRGIGTQIGQGVGAEFYGSVRVLAVSGPGSRLAVAVGSATRCGVENRPDGESRATQSGDAAPTWRRARELGQ